MKYSAIICEYNCLHNGHIRLMDFARANGQQLVCIMSGNFTQRGMPAVASKYTRARHAIMAGASIVVELPTMSATSSAQDFALGAVNIANSLGIDYLYFGSEVGDTKSLEQCASVLNNEHINTTVKEHLSRGMSYPKALANSYPQYSAILDKPNNVLALEYIKALQLTNSNIQPITLSRQDNYNSTQLHGQYASATAIRNNINDDNIAQYAPSYVLSDVDITTEQRYKEYATTYLSTQSPQQLAKIYGSAEGLHNRIYQYATLGDYEQMVTNIKSKRYTMLRIQRLLLHSVLGITNETMQQYKNNPTPIRVLAVDSNHADTILAHCSRAPLITCDSDEHDIDRVANRLYSTLSHTPMGHSMIKI